MKQLIQDIKLAWRTACWCRDNPDIDRSFISLLLEELIWVVKETIGLNKMEER